MKANKEIKDAHERAVLLAAMGRRTLERVLENMQQLVAKGGNPMLVEQAQARLDKYITRGKP